MATVPRRTREMTPQWLAEVFAESGIAAPAIADVSVETISVGSGFAGRALRLSVEYADDPSRTAAPSTLIAKMPSIDPTMRSLMESLRGYEVEGRFYAQLAGSTPTPTPRCYWNGASPDSGDYCLLIEDLVGYELGGQGRSDVDPDAITSLVTEAARLHRQWWNDAELQTVDWLARPNDEQAYVPHQHGMAGWGIWRQRFGADLSDADADDLRRAVQAVPEFAPLAAEGASTLVHGDYRLDNAMFNAANAERPLVIIDWQMARYGSGAYDIAYLLSQSVPVELRRRHEDDWLARYVEELAQPGYDEARLRADFAVGLLYAMTVPLMNATLSTAVRQQVEAMPASEMRDGYVQALDAADALGRVQSDWALAAIADHDAVAQATRRR